MAEIAGGHPGTPVTSLPQAIRVLSETIGLSRLARDLGVSRSTLRGWRDGRTPRTDRRWIVTEAEQHQRRERLDRDRERHLRRPWALDGLQVTATYHYARGGSMKGTEQRTLPLGDYMNDVADELVDAYLDGASPAELAEIFTDGINDHGWYAQTFSEDGDGAWDIHGMEGWG